jgi:hypothetical protein
MADASAICMQSEIVAMLMPEDSPGAALLVRRADGQFALERIDSRVAAASRVAATWFREGSGGEDQSACALMELEMV